MGCKVLCESDDCVFVVDCSAKPDETVVKQWIIKHTDMKILTSDERAIMISLRACRPLQGRQEDRYREQLVRGREVMLAVMNVVRLYLGE